MKLNAYLKKYHIKQKILSQVLDITPGSISHKITGKRQWKPKEAILIENFTKGMVSRMEVLYPNE